MREVIRRNIFRSHQHTAKITQYRPCRALRVESGRIPIAAYQSWHLGERLQMIENDLHLQRAMSPRAMRVEMNRNRAKRTDRVLDLRDQGTQPPEPFLLTLHLVLAVRDRH